MLILKQDGERGQESLSALAPVRNIVLHPATNNGPTTTRRQRVFCCQVPKLNTRFRQVSNVGEVQIMGAASQTLFYAILTKWRPGGLPDFLTVIIFVNIRLQLALYTLRHDMFGFRMRCHD